MIPGLSVVAFTDTLRNVSSAAVVAYVSHHTNTKTIIAAANGRVPVVEMPTNTLAAGFLFGEVVPQSASVQQWASAVTRALERSDDDRSAMQAYARTMYSWANVLHADLVDYLYTLSS